MIELEDAETGESVVIDTSDPTARELFAGSVAIADSARSRLFTSIDLDAIPVRTGENYERSLVRFFRTRAKKAK